MNAVMWRKVDGSGLERCQLTSDPGGVRLAGTSLLSTDAGPVEIRYSVRLSSTWETDSVGVHVRGPDEDRSVALRRDPSGRWSVGETDLEWLDGVTDPDFSWTPATNTIPLRRLQLEIGAAAEIEAVLIPYPGRDLERRTQRYERLAQRRWRYTSGDYETDLTTDESGLVVAYPGQWMAV